MREIGDGIMNLNMRELDEVSGREEKRKERERGKEGKEREEKVKFVRRTMSRILEGNW